jgi:hypothetical protein
MPITNFIFQYCRNVVDNPCCFVKNMGNCNSMSKSRINADWKKFVTFLSEKYKIIDSHFDTSEVHWGFSEFASAFDGPRSYYLGNIYFETPFKQYLLSTHVEISDSIFDFGVADVSFGYFLKDQNRTSYFHIGQFMQNDCRNLVNEKQYHHYFGLKNMFGYSLVNKIVNSIEFGFNSTVFFGSIPIPTHPIALEQMSRRLNYLSMSIDESVKKAFDALYYACDKKLSEINVSNLFLITPLRNVIISYLHNT